MIKRLQGSFLLVFFSLFLLAGCYHATIDTGLAPGAKTIKKPWAHCFVFGLVPPSVVEAQNECENGVARVETQHSFLNGLVGILTYAIYTPMTITVTCAAKDMSAVDESEETVVSLPYGSDYAQIMDAFDRASDMAVVNEQPTYVQFKHAEFNSVGTSSPESAATMSRGSE